MTKSKSTIERDKRLRRTAQETRDAGLRTPVSVRLTPEERAELESYGQMRGMSLSEAIRSRACRYSPSEEKVAAYTERLYYGMRETGVELIESNSAVRIAYEENARAAFALSSAVRRVGVNLNQIAKRVNAGAVDDDGETWLAELQKCTALLSEILETGNVKEVRPIPILETRVSKGGADASAEPEKTSESKHGNRVETDAETDAGTTAEKALESTRKPEAKTTAKTKPKPTGKPASETAPKKKSEKPRGKSAEKMQEASTEPEREKPGAEAVGGTREGSRKYDVKRDEEWMLGLLDKNGMGDSKRYFQEAREMMREGNGE